MDLVVEGNSERIKVRVSGHINAECSADLRSAVIELCARQPQSLTLDLAEVPFIDTSGLGVLVGLRTHLKKHGTTMLVVAPQKRVLEVFRLTRLSTLFGLEGEPK